MPRKQSDVYRLKRREEAWAAEYVPEKVVPRRIPALLACLGRNTRSLPACCPCRPRRPTEKQIVHLQASLGRQLMPGPPVNIAHGRRPRSSLPHEHPDLGSEPARPPIERESPPEPDLLLDSTIDPETGLLRFGPTDEELLLEDLTVPTPKHLEDADYVHPPVVLPAHKQRLLVMAPPIDDWHQSQIFDALPGTVVLAVGETVILLCPPLPLSGVSTWINRGCQ